MAPTICHISELLVPLPFQVVTHKDMVEMLTDYDYTIDATSDAAGAPETFGPEAGNGIISAQQMCRWVADNCAQACPGETSTMKRLTQMVLQKMFPGQGRPRLMTSGPESFNITFIFRCHNIVEKRRDTSRPGPLAVGTSWEIGLPWTQSFSNNNVQKMPCV